MQVFSSLNYIMKLSVQKSAKSDSIKEWWSVQKDFFLQYKNQNLFSLYLYKDQKAQRKKISKYVEGYQLHLH